MWRHISRIARALSVTTCAFATVLGVRSHFVCDGIAWRAHGGEPWNQVVSSRWRIELQRWTPELECSLSSARAGVSISHYPVDRRDIRSTSICGFGWYRSGNSRYVAVPHYAIAVAGVVLTFGCVVQHKPESHQRVSACCIACGYDLRATPNRCPECGKPTSAEFADA